MEKKYTKMINVPMKEEMKEKIIKICKERDITVASFIRECIKDMLSINNIDAKPITVCEKDLEYIISENPLVGRYGFESEIKLDVNNIILFKEFEQCVLWMNKNLEIHRNYKCDSYEIKHLVENDVGLYIPSGAVIAAALFLGIPIKNKDKNPLLAAKVYSKIY